MSILIIFAGDLICFLLGYILGAVFRVGKEADK